jgi:hypothetical protein
MCRGTLASFIVLEGSEDVSRESQPSYILLPQVTRFLLQRVEKRVTFPHSLTRLSKVGLLETCMQSVLDRTLLNH